MKYRDNSHAVSLVAQLHGYGDVVFELFDHLVVVQGFHIMRIQPQDVLEIDMRVV